MIQKEKTLSTRTVFKGKIIKVDVLDIEFEDKTKSKREIVNHNGGATILARDEDNKILFIKQYRKAVEDAVIELPTGKLEERENPDLCAERELSEETGYSSDHIEKLGEVILSPGYLTEKIHIYKASNLYEKQAQQDKDEHLDMIRLSDDEVKEKILSGEIYDAKTLCALYLEGLKDGR